MYIKNILNYDDFSGEADIIVTDGVYEIMCYCHPIDNPRANKSVKSIVAFLAENIMTEPHEKPMVKKTDESYYSYCLVGNVINREKCLISIGELIIELDGYLPGDIKVGDMVKLTAARMDAHI